VPTLSAPNDYRLASPFYDEVQNLKRLAPALEISHTFLARRKIFKKVAVFPPFFSCKDYLVTEARVIITREKKNFTDFL
jgi:hypothetical protein